MYISGDGVARGYLNRPELTAEKFVPNPFVPGKRMYRTGDLANWLPNGEIECLGRIDHQVQIRGFRIELGEIEAQLLQIEDLQEAVVLARESEDSQNELCAYIVSEKEWTVAQLRAELSDVLPTYMIPSHFVQVGKLPLTPNGKIDRKALLEQSGNLCTGIAYVEPRSITEWELAGIWEEILGLEGWSPRSFL